MYRIGERRKEGVGIFVLSVVHVFLLAPSGEPLHILWQWLFYPQRVWTNTLTSPQPGQEFEPGQQPGVRIQLQPSGNEAQRGRWQS